MNKTVVDEEKIISDKIESAILKNQEKMTDEQKYAVNFNGNKNILISAAAGSGKTFVLVQRILKLIAEDKKDIRKILLATFTNAAAAQMSKKVYDALNKLIYEENINSKHLKEQLSSLAGANIGTLHSLCIKIIKSYFYITNAPCDFSIIDGAEDILLKEEALNETLQNLYEESEDNFTYLSNTYITVKGIDNLKQIILQSHNYAQSRPERLLWLKDEIEYYKTCNCVESSKWTKHIYTQYSEILEQAIKLQEMAFELASDCLDDKSINQLKEEKDKIKNLLQAVETGNDILNICNLFEFASLRIPPKYNGYLKNDIKNMRDIAKMLSLKIANNIKSYSFDKARRENEKLYILLSSLYDVIEKFDKCYSEKKAKRKVITFNDCEHICLEILKHKDISTEIKENYDYVYIDEYQDISMLQEEILKLISKEDNMFMVGDIKQSIYRFRLAEPDIFNSKYELYKKEKQKNELIILNKNFRSSKYVIDSVNAVFSQIMNKEAADIDYDENAKLVFTGDNKNNGAKTDIYIFVKRNNKSIDADEDCDIQSEDALTDYENAELEAKNTAEIIKNLLNTQIFDKEINTYRNAEYRDIAILLSSANIDGPHYADVFSQNNIPVFFDANKNYFDNMEICTIINLLYVIDNDYDDIALISVMRTPFFDFSVKEMFEIRKHYNQGFYYEAIKNYIDTYNDSLSRKLKDFYNFIYKHRDLSRHIGIYDLIINIYDETGYYEYVALLEQGRNRKDNLFKLLDIAKKYERSGACGLFSFINYLKKIKISQTDNFSLSSADKDNNCVKIMSIHKSKGLEFPIVIIGRTSKEFNKADTQKEIIFHKDLGIGATFYDMELGYKCDSLAKIAIKSAVDDEITAEQMRLLYVAMTRAEEKLIITSIKNEKELENKKNKWSKAILSNQIKSFTSYIDWIMYSIMKEDFTWDEEIFKVYFADCINDTAKKEKKLTKKEIFKLLKSGGAGQIDKETEHKLKWVYDYKDEIKLPQKLTVTDIKNRKSVKTYVSFENTDENNFSSLRKGRIVHYIMQTIDLEEIKKSDHENYISKFLDELEYKNVIDKKDKEFVNINAIANFFKSDTGKLILNADSVKREVEFYYIENASKINEEINSNNEKIYVQGVIDCVIENNEGIYIIDYKTDTYYNKRDKQEKINEYSVQIEIYKEAYEKIMDVQNVKCILSFINMGENIIIN